MARNMIFLMFALSVIGSDAQMTAYTTPSPIIGRSPTLESCNNDMCLGKPDGNFAFTTKIDELLSNVTVDGVNYYDYFLSCSNGLAQCMSCANNAYFNEDCNQCLTETRLAEVDPCHQVVNTTGAPLICPPLNDATAAEECAKHTPMFIGNLVDPRNNPQREPTTHYIGCWKGTYRGCNICPSRLLFNEEPYNATAPEHQYYGKCDYPSR